MYVKLNVCVPVCIFVCCNRFFRSSSSNNSFVGTQDYVSPEVLAGEASGVTKACDLWALGCILYQLFSGALIVVKLYNTIHL